LRTCSADIFNNIDCVLTAEEAIGAEGLMSWFFQSPQSRDCQSWPITINQPTTHSRDGDDSDSKLVVDWHCYLASQQQNLQERTGDHHVTLRGLTAESQARAIETFET
jgi:hypothetical protein